MNYTDGEIRELLKDLDESRSITVTSWEADFIESIVYRNSDRPLSEPQRRSALGLIEKYDLH